MFRNSLQRGLISVLFSGGSNPLGIWETTKSKDGYIQRFLDQDIKAMVIELGGNNVSTTYLSCPPGKQVLGIYMPFLVMIVKNLKKYFVFEITILDETKTRRRFRIANFQSTTQITPLCTVMPIHLSDGWNQIQFNLAEFTRRAYNKQFVEVQKIRINANIRIRRIYCAAKLMSEEELPPEYKLYLPLPAKKKEKGKENKKQQASVTENVKVVKSYIDEGAAKEATAEGASTEEALVEVMPAEQVPAEAVPAEQVFENTAVESVLGEGKSVEAMPVEGKSAEEIPDEVTPTDETVEREAAVADETLDDEITDVLTPPESEAPVVEPSASADPIAEDVAPLEPAQTEPLETEEPGAEDDAPPPAE